MTPDPTTHAMSPPRAVALALSAAAATAVGSVALGPLRSLRPRLERTNFHGRRVSLRGGIGAAAGAVAAGAQLKRLPAACGSPRVAMAALVTTTSAGIAGLVDDLDDGAHDGEQTAKGLAGHLRALARGRVTTGVLKIAVIGSGSLVSGVLLARHRSAVDHVRYAGRAQHIRYARTPVATALDAVASAVVVAAWANLHNLLDLRPGRALKAAGLTSACLLVDGRAVAGASRALAAGTLGVVAATLPEDLTERTMLGDTGANAVGALVGTALAAHPSPVLRGGAALSGTCLVLASERVSFSRVIARTPVLAGLDGLGRLPS